MFLIHKNIFKFCYHHHVNIYFDKSRAVAWRGVAKGINRQKPPVAFLRVGGCPMGNNLVLTINNSILVFTMTGKYS